MHMGFAKVLLGLKEGGLSKCARVDSLGLAKRRLAAKAVHDDFPQEVPDSDEAPSATVANEDCLPQGQDPELQDEQEDTDGIFVDFINRQHRDSLRGHRRRFRERASLDVTSSRMQNTVRDTGASWSGEASRTGQGAEEEDVEEDEQEVVGSPDGSRHVRFRRASDGEYLVQRSPKSLEAGPPNALKAVQLKAERLFRRLTAPLTAPFSENPTRPRSSTPSRSSSPTRCPRPGSRSSASWGLGLRHRSVDAGPLSPVSLTGSSPSAVTVAAADLMVATADGRSSAPVGLRDKRKSAPGELFLAEVPAAPPSSLPRPISGAGRGGDSSGASPMSSANKSKNWLARLSRGLGGQGTGSPPVCRALPAQPTTSPPSSPGAAGQPSPPTSLLPLPSCGRSKPDCGSRESPAGGCVVAKTVAGDDVEAKTADMAVDAAALVERSSTSC